MQDAGRHLDEAVDRQPRDHWAHFYQGVCAYRRQQYAIAVAAFTVCISQAPDTALFRHNRALALTALGEKERARRDYDQALVLEPGLAEAALNRAMLHYDAKRFSEAAADLQRAGSNGADSVAVNYNLALLRVAQKDRDGARLYLRKVLDRQPDHVEARDLLRQLDTNP